jgi:hypothetical protein
MIMQSEFRVLLERAEAEILQTINAFGSLEKPSGGGTDVGVADNELDGHVLRVGCCCARGRHRSVAFVEELARRQWPKDWDVQVEHRDLCNNKGSSAKQKSSKRKSNLRESYLEESTEE